MDRIMWNPWHGCIKVSEGCLNCYMYQQDREYGVDPKDIHQNKTRFNLLTKKDRRKMYKVESGSLVMVSLSSDFFLPEADQWREAAWEQMRARRSLYYHIITKRPELIAERLPPDWGDGWNNVMISATCENTVRAVERIPVLADLPLKHRGIICAPMLEEINLSLLADKHISRIERIGCSGENGPDARPVHHEWVMSLRAFCQQHCIDFDFFQTGTNYIKDGKHYVISDIALQKEQAEKAGLNLTFS